MGNRELLFRNMDRTMDLDTPDDDDVILVISVRN